MSAMFSVCSVRAKKLRLCDMQNHRTALLNSPDQEQSKYLRGKLLEGVSISSHKDSVSINFVFAILL